MEYQKVTILLDDKTIEAPKFRTFWVEMNNELRRTYNGSD